jgi:EAL domain-containing protein (putative c-di-GMP-specific phosphodiesterase class I)
MCKRLQVDCVVEGVETETQKAAILALGCKLGQGYLFAKPMSETDVSIYLIDCVKRQKSLSMHHPSNATQLQDLGL